MDKYEALEDETFAESYLVDVRYAPWPHTMIFYVWSTHRQCCYRIVATTVIEFHYENVYTGPFGYDAVLLGAISIARNEDHRYWSDRIRLLATQSTGDEREPVCLVFDSHVFAGRRHDGRLTTEEIGMLVVCRDFDIELDTRYDGPRPFPHNIPSTDE